MITELPLLSEIAVGVSIASISGLFVFMWNMNATLKEISMTTKSFEKAFELAALRMDALEKRLNVCDQIFSDLAERGVNTNMIADKSQDHPEFKFKRRKHSFKSGEDVDG